MSAVPEPGGGRAGPAGAPDPAHPPVPGRRLVAVTVSPLELLRPASDLVRLMAGAAEVDVLIAGEHRPVVEVRPIGYLDRPAGPPGDDEPGTVQHGAVWSRAGWANRQDGDREPAGRWCTGTWDSATCDDDGDLGAGDGWDDDWDDEAPWDDDWDDEAPWDDDAEGPEDDELDEVRAAAERLGVTGLRLHRLGLRTPLAAHFEADIVAALSELIGFDPEPGVYCLAPEHAGTDPSRTVVDRAAQRIARAYGIPLLRYRCLGLSVVAPEPVSGPPAGD